LIATGASPLILLVKIEAIVKKLSLSSAHYSPAGDLSPAIQ
jgi:hypothetical protein